MSSLFRSVPASSGRETSRFFIGRLRLGLTPSADRFVTGTRSGGRRTIVLLVMGLSLVASPARAQSCSLSSELLAALPAWNAPLDRRVSLHVRDISLRDALDRVSADARIRLSYASEAIPLDNRVCASFDAIPLGEALGLLLRGTPVLPISAGGESVVLAPSEIPGTSEQHDRVPRVLDRVV